MHIFTNVILILVLYYNYVRCTHSGKTSEEPLWALFAASCEPAFQSKNLETTTKTPIWTCTNTLTLAVTNV